MDIEGLFLLSCTCCEGNDAKVCAFSSRTPMTNCHKKMLNDLKSKIPKNTKCHGLIASRVAMKSGDEKMYFISQQKPSDGKRTLMRQHISVTRKIKKV